MYIGYYGEFHFPLSYYLKAAKSTFGFTPDNLFVSDKMRQTSVANCLTKCLKLILRAFSHKLDPAIRQVPHITRDFKSCCNRLCSVPEPDTLNVPRIKNLHAFSLHTRKDKHNSTRLCSRPFPGQKPDALSRTRESCGTRTSRNDFVYVK